MAKTINPSIRWDAKTRKPVNFQRWASEMSKGLLNQAHMLITAAPVKSLLVPKKSGETGDHGQVGETSDASVSRFDNEGGRIT